MTVALVREAIRSFLRTETPQVLCIRGKWGVGKTFIWTDVFKEAKAAGTVALPYYCYVSLFGLQSIDEVRQTIFENRVTTRQVEIEPTLESLRENVRYYAQAAGRQISKYSKFAKFAKVPYLDRYIANFSGGFRQVVSLAVRDTIICFDDFERKKLSAKDLLGLVSQFREQKACKAVIILNEDALSNDEKAEFRRYFEKVVEIPIEFAPTPTECADIAIPDTGFASDSMRADAIALGISNIRIIYRIRKLADDLLQIFEPFSQATKRQALHTLTLLVWSKYDEGAIPLSFIVERAKRSLFYINKEERTEEEKQCGPVLEAYKFGYCDKLDLAILSGVERGFFDKGELVAEAQQQDEREAEAASRQALHDAWRIFHGSFDDNLPQVVEAICSAYRKHMKAASRGNLDEAVSMLRSLGCDEQASQLVSLYIEANRGQITAVDDGSDPFRSGVKDEEFRQQLAAVVVPPAQKPFKDIFIDIYQGQLHHDDMQATLSLSVDDLYRLFRDIKGDDLYRVIEGALFWRRVINATAEQKEMTKKALEALTMIGRESPLNAHRVVKFGVVLDEDKPATAADD
jgi:hypothetical protein